MSGLLAALPAVPAVLGVPQLLAVWDLQAVPRLLAVWDLLAVLRPASELGPNPAERALTLAAGRAEVQ